MKMILYLVGLLLTVDWVHAADLIVNISNIEAKQGKIRIALYNHAKDFPEGQKYFRGEELTADKENLSIIFKNLPAGRYAVALMQDYNENGILDRNFFGMPTEPYGFSQRDSGETGQPSFDQAALSITQENQTIHVKLVK